MNSNKLKSSYEFSIAPNSVLALDLEGTLISNAMSQIPRPNLHPFLTNCKQAFQRIVIFTAINEERFRKIAILLSDEGAAPEWFKDLEYINWSGEHKDLNFIPNSNMSRTILVDDRVEYIQPSQIDYWLYIPEFAPPYPGADNELNLLWEKLLKRHSDLMK